MIGKTVGHYQVIDKIGEGGMGAVYKAEDTTLHRLVALKTLSGHLTEDEEAKERFVREAQSASSLNHPNITTIYEFLEEDDTRLICMEYIEGKTIRDMVESGVVSVRKAIDIIIQAAEALDAAHGKGILHRDVKSANIMVNMEGRVKIMDFGLAHLEERSQLTRTGTTLGTLSYSSPEQISGRTVNQGSEVFSLGVVFYELLTGQLPFKASNEAEILFAIINNEPTKISNLREDVPELVEAVVSKMLEKDSELRYQTCADVIHDLQGIRKEMETSTVGTTSVLKRVQDRSRKRTITIVTAGMLAVAGLVTISLLLASPEPGMLAVLPFENLNPPEDVWFSDSVTEEVMDLLTGLGIPVLSRNSTFQYKGEIPPPSQISEELNAEYILTATLRWQKLEEDHSTILIRAELVRGANAERVWSATYDEDYSEIFNIQTQIAEGVAQIFGVTIAESEREVLEARSTNNMQAHQAYLRGLDADRQPTSEQSHILTAQMFQLAIELDPSFALAWAKLSKAHAQLYHYRDDFSRERQLMAKAAAEQALALAPESPQVHRDIAWYYYWAFKDYGKALEEFSIAEVGLPNDAEILGGSGYVLRRQGRLEEALDKLKRAFDLDPQYASLAMEIGSTSLSLRQYREANEYFDQSIALDPEQIYAYGYKADIDYTWNGSTELARASLVNMPQVLEPAYYCYYWFKQEMFEGNYRKAIEDLSAYPFDNLDSQGYFYPIALLSAQAYRLSGDLESAYTSFDKARLILEEEVTKRPDDNRIRSALGLAYAGLGRNEDAIREGELSVSLFPMSFDAWWATLFIEELARILVMVGDYSEAIEKLEFLLSKPVPGALPHLKLDPSWDPLRELPRFQALLEKYE
ncbi:protein kinase [Gemmatimonadota bacterium]